MARSERSSPPRRAKTRARLARNRSALQAPFGYSRGRVKRYGQGMLVVSAVAGCVSRRLRVRKRPETYTRAMNRYGYDGEQSVRRATVNRCAPVKIAARVAESAQWRAAPSAASRSNRREPARPPASPPYRSPGAAARRSRPGVWRFRRQERRRDPVRLDNGEIARSSHDDTDRFASPRRPCFHLPHSTSCLATRATGMALTLAVKNPPR